MNVGFVSSSESSKCAVCGKKTAHYKVYIQSDISIKIPLCNKDSEGDCYRKVDVKDISSSFITLLNKAIKLGVN